MKEFDQQEKILSTTYRRLENLWEDYSKQGSYLFVVRELYTKRLIACIGIGSFQGLPWSEKIGEIRDLVVHRKYGCQGIGQMLLENSLEKAKEFGYKRLYLEVSKHMIVAKKLFRQNGFNPVEQLPKQDLTESMPCYFLLTDITSVGHEKS